MARPRLRLVRRCPHCRAKFEVPVPHQEEDEDESEGLDDTVTEDPLHDLVARDLAVSSQVEVHTAVKHAELEAYFCFGYTARFQIGVRQGSAGNSIADITGAHRYRRTVRICDEVGVHCIEQLV